MLGLVNEQGFEPVTFTGLAAVFVQTSGSVEVIAGGSGNSTNINVSEGYVGELDLTSGSPVDPVYLVYASSGLTIDPLFQPQSVTLDGTNGNDQITVTGISPALASVNLNAGDLSFDIVPGDVSNLTIDGGNGNDMLMVNSLANSIAIPIAYDGGSGNNEIELAGGSVLSDTYTPGAGAGAGQSLLTFLDDSIESVAFTNVSPAGGQPAVYDYVNGPLTIDAPPGNNSIDYTFSGPNPEDAVVSVNSLAAIDFSGRTTLSIDGGTGIDAFYYTNGISLDAVADGVTLFSANAKSSLVYDAASATATPIITPDFNFSGTIASGADELAFVDIPNITVDGGNEPGVGLDIEPSNTNFPYGSYTVTSGAALTTELSTENRSFSATRWLPSQPLPTPTSTLTGTALNLALSPRWRLLPHLKATSPIIPFPNPTSSSPAMF